MEDKEGRACEGRHMVPAGIRLPGCPGGAPARAEAAPRGGCTGHGRSNEKTTSLLLRVFLISVTVLLHLFSLPGPSLPH